jgi:hypothetical protein
VYLLFCTHDHRRRNRAADEATAGSFWYRPRVSIDLGRRLVASGLVDPREVEAALFISVARGVPLARVLLDRGAISERALEDELERTGGLGLRRVAIASELVARLPKAMCRRLAALPTRLDPQTNTVDIVAADPLDPHIASEFGFHLGTGVRVFRASIAAVEDAIRRLELDEQPLSPTEAVPEPAAARPRRVTPPFPHGAPETVPPPLTDHTPIPLVRKIAFASEEAGSHDVAHFSPSSEADSLVVPLRRVKPAEPENETPLPLRRTKMVVSPELPSISFPSEPPPDLVAPDSALRIAPPETPPYGMPALGRPRSAMPVTTEPTPTVKGMALIEPTPMLDWNDDAPAGEEAQEPARVSPPKQLRAPDGSAVLEALAQASNRDEVVRLALRGMRLVARRLAVFAVRRDGFHGWACNVEFGDPDDLRALMIPHELPSVLATAAAADIYLGAVPRTPAHEGLLRVMEQSSDDVAVLSVRVGGRAAMILVADDLEDTLIGTRWMEQLSEAIGEALSRVLAVKG